MLTPDTIEKLKKTATSVRALSMDAVQKANSGHPGLPLGIADLGALLFSQIMRHDPQRPDWADRDRFVLSAGHGSMFLYSLLHLSGYGLSLDEIKNFRQIGSKTPGHPEFGHTVGIETTTGPLGAGFSNAVGMAIAETMLAARFNTAADKIVDHYTYAISGDGCLMEGVSAEAASLAGHLKLGKLIVFYDSNSITIEGDTSIAFTEDVAKRFQAYGWQTLAGDAYDVQQVASLVEEAKRETEKPTLIILKSIIGYGAPNKAGSHSVHGSPLGADEVAASRAHLGIPVDKDFYVFPEVYDYMKDCAAAGRKLFDDWNTRFNAWAKANPELKKEWDLFMSGDLSAAVYPPVKEGDKSATRVASGNTIQSLSESLPFLVGGSADLAPSNNTAMKGAGDYSAANRKGRVMHFGVREHAMGGVANGMLLHGGFRTFCATFLVFSDYMRPTVRLAALMNIPQIFVFTHDSIFVGEDGPTHQPIEHVESLRLIPNLLVLRPADAEETSLCWKLALEEKRRPSCMILTRQNLPWFKKNTDKEKTLKLGYFIAKDEANPEVTVLASGSEVALALGAAAKSKKRVRVISVFSRELFIAQSKGDIAKLLGNGAKVVAAEAGVTTGWKGLASEVLGIDRFGESGPGEKVAERLGLTEENLLAMIER